MCSWVAQPSGDVVGGSWRQPLKTPWAKPPVCAVARSCPGISSILACPPRVTGWCPPWPGATRFDGGSSPPRKVEPIPPIRGDRRFGQAHKLFTADAAFTPFASGVRCPLRGPPGPPFLWNRRLPRGPLEPCFGWNARTWLACSTPGVPSWALRFDQLLGGVGSGVPMVPLLCEVHRVAAGLDPLSRPSRVGEAPSTAESALPPRTGGGPRWDQNHPDLTLARPAKKKRLS